MWLILKPLPYCYPTLQPLYILGRSRTWLSTDQDREGGRCGTILIQQCPTVGLELVTRKGKKVSDLVEDSAT